MRESSEERRRTFHTLDGLRGIAALAVVGRHLNGELLRLMPSSHLAVDLFFVLSGFVLSHAYEERLRTSLTFGRFMVMRLVRLWPLYILGTAIGVAVVLRAAMHGAAFDAPVFVASLLCASVFLPTFRSISFNHFHLYPFNFPAWSLLWELAVNFLFAAIARRLHTVLLVSIIALGALLLVYTSWRHEDGLAGGSNFHTWWVGGGKVVFSFFAGVGVHRLYKRKALVWLRAPAWLASIVLIAVFVARPSTHAWLYDAAVALLLFPALVLAATAEPSERMRPIFARLGVMSYAVYAIHAPFAQLALPHLHAIADRGRMQLFVAESAFVCLVAALALAIDHWFDKPARRRLTELATRAFAGRRQSLVRSGETA